MKKDSFEVLMTIICGPITRQTCTGDLTNTGRRIGKTLTDGIMRYAKTETLCDSATWDDVWQLANVGPKPTGKKAFGPEWTEYMKKYKSARVVDLGYLDRFKTYTRCLNKEGWPAIIEKDSIEHLRFSRGQ